MLSNVNNYVKHLITKNKVLLRMEVHDYHFSLKTEFIQGCRVPSCTAFLKIKSKPSEGMVPSTTTQLLLILEGNKLSNINNIFVWTSQIFNQLTQKAQDHFSNFDGALSTTEEEEDGLQVQYCCCGKQLRHPLQRARMYSKRSIHYHSHHWCKM